MAIQVVIQIVSANNLIGVRYNITLSNSRQEQNVIITVCLENDESIKAISSIHLCDAYIIV